MSLPVLSAPKHMSLLSIESASSIPTADLASGKNIHWTCDSSVELPIKLGLDRSCPSSRPPCTVSELFERTVRAHGNLLALRVKREGKWVEWTWQEYYDDCVRFAKAAMNIGMPVSSAVSIIGFNSPEWFIANIGAILAGGMAAGIYTTNNAESVWYVANHSESRIAIVENTEQAEKFVTKQSRLPNLLKIVQYDNSVSADHRAAGVITWKEFLATSSEVPDPEFQARKLSVKPGNCCTLIYTSGTTGNPKAVMLSHDNLTWTSSVSLEPATITCNDRIVSYLPLSHVAAQLIDVYLPMSAGSSVTFADADAMKGTLTTTLVETRPTMFLGVPRVWEKIEEKMKLIGSANGMLKQAIGTWAKGVGLSGSYSRLEGKGLPWGWSLADTLVFANVKKALGLDQCRLRVTSAAPISKETLEYFMSLDMPLLEIYGMSECSGPHGVNYPHAQKMFTVGTPFPGVFHKIDAEKSINTSGEVWMWGRHVFMGYLKDEVETMKAVDKNGFLHTGDLGKVDEDAFLQITGRIKELLITAGGENVAPVVIEEELKKELPVIANAMVIGDRKRFLSALLTIRVEPDSDIVSEQAVQWLNSIGVEATFGKTKVDEIHRNELLLRAIQEGVDKANKAAISKAQLIQKWALVPDFSLAGGELTPTLKLKRRVVMQKYSDLIDAFYVEAKI